MYICMCCIKQLAIKTKHFHWCWYFSTDQWICSGGYFIWVVVSTNHCRPLWAHPWYYTNILPDSEVRGSLQLINPLPGAQRARGLSVANFLWPNTQVVYLWNTPTIIYYVYIHTHMVQLKGNLTHADRAYATYRLKAHGYINTCAVGKTCQHYFCKRQGHRLRGHYSRSSRGYILFLQWLCTYTYV